MDSVPEPYGQNRRNMVCSFYQKFRRVCSMLISFFLFVFPIVALVSGVLYLP